MSWILYTLLDERSPPQNIDDLMSQVETEFSRSKDFCAKFERPPLSRNKSIRLQWGTWSADLHYTDGEQAMENIVEIKRRLGDNAPSGLEGRARYVYAVFGADPDDAHVNQSVALMQFLEGIQGAIVFDPQRNKFLSA